MKVSIYVLLITSVVLLYAYCLYILLGELSIQSFAWICLGSVFLLLNYNNKHSLYIPSTVLIQTKK